MRARPPRRAAGLPPCGPPRGGRSRRRRRQIGAPAAQGTRRSRSPDHAMQPVARRGEHALGRFEVLPLEGAVEGVGEKDHVLAVAAHVRGMRDLPVLPPRPTPDRQGPPRRKAQQLLRQRGEARNPVPQVERRGEKRRDRRIARQMGDKPVLQAPPAAGVIVVQELDLHPRHVDARRAFSLAGLATDAEIHGLLHVSRCEGLGSELARDGEAQRVRPAAGRMRLVLRCAVGRAHRAAGKLPAGAVVVAHLHGGAEAAMLRPVERGGTRQCSRITRRKAHERAVVEAEDIHLPPAESRRACRPRDLPGFIISAGRTQSSPRGTRARAAPRTMVR